MEAEVGREAQIFPLNPRSRSAARCSGCIGLRMPVGTRDPSTDTRRGDSQETSEPPCVTGGGELRRLWICEV